MTPENNPQPIIDRMPGMPKPEDEQPRRGVIPIKNPGPQTMNHAINSPYRRQLGPNVIGGPEEVKPEQSEALGSTATASQVEVIEPSADQPATPEAVNRYAERLGGTDTTNG